MAPDPKSPIRHFEADSPFSKSKSAWVVQTYGRLQNLTEVEEGILPQILRKQAKGNFGKSKQATFCAKQANFAQTGHTPRRAELCVAARGGYFEHLL